MTAVTSREYAAKLRALVAKQATLREAAVELRKPRSTLYDYARRHGVSLRRRALPQDKERRLARVMTREASIRTMAAIVGCGKSTVQRRLRKRNEKIVGDGPRPCPKWRCGCGLLLQIDRCLRCGQKRSLLNATGARPARTAGQRRHRS